MKLLSINVGQPRAHQVSGKPNQTGIYKLPTTEPVHVGRLGLAGDHILDVQSHGGPDQAVYVYSAQDYDWWAEQQGDALDPGTFGENLTFDGFGPGKIRVGDRFQVGPVLLEVTSPRIPCGTLAARMNDLMFVKKFVQARRPGFYARVLTEGELRTGDEVTRNAAPDDAPTIMEMADLFYNKSPDRASIERMLRYPVAIRDREAYEAMLAK